jgi:hypothetical protein
VGELLFASSAVVEKFNKASNILLAIFEMMRIRVLEKERLALSECLAKDARRLASQCDGAKVRGRLSLSNELTSSSCGGARNIPKATVWFVPTETGRHGKN